MTQRDYYWDHLGSSIFFFIENVSLLCYYFYHCFFLRQFETGGTALKMFTCT